MYISNCGVCGARSTKYSQYCLVTKESMWAYLIDSLHMRRLLHSPSFRRQSRHYSEMPPNKDRGIQGLYSVAVATCGVSVPVGQHVEGVGMHVTACDMGVTATKQPHCNVSLHCLCLDIFQDNLAPSRWTLKQKSRWTPQQQDGMMNAWAKVRG